ncbi:MYO2 [Symbiodinium necroappetens]|uniref:MYO2 protein n=1 Tax=Symbiodinium necroappetens TaxID=1628268 RepID=A0A812Z4J8_9DINO|nr:MYO2 [Symbiodinium necroappetens]
MPLRCQTELERWHCQLSKRADRPNAGCAKDTPNQIDVAMQLARTVSALRSEPDGPELYRLNDAANELMRMLPVTHSTRKAAAREGLVLPGRPNYRYFGRCAELRYVVEAVQSLHAEKTEGPELAAETATAEAAAPSAMSTKRNGGLTVQLLARSAFGSLRWCHAVRLTASRLEAVREVWSACQHLLACIQSLTFFKRVPGKARERRWQAVVWFWPYRGSWQRGTVQAALGSGRYKAQKYANGSGGLDRASRKVALQGWEEDELQTSQTTEVDASNMEGGMLPFQNADMPNNGFPDMTTLDHLHEPALLHNLRRRFFSQACDPDHDQESLDMDTSTEEFAARPWNDETLIKEGLKQDQSLLDMLQGQWYRKEDGQPVGQISGAYLVWNPRWKFAEMISPIFEDLSGLAPMLTLPFPYEDYGTEYHAYDKLHSSTSSSRSRSSGW